MKARSAQRWSVSGARSLPSVAKARSEPHSLWRLGILMWSVLPALSHEGYERAPLVRKWGALRAFGGEGSGRASLTRVARHLDAKRAPSPQP